MIVEREQCYYLINSVQLCIEEYFGVALPGFSSGDEHPLSEKKKSLQWIKSVL